MRSWIIGNSAHCDIVVDSPLASSRHCQLSQTADGYILDDLGSTNGTYVDGLRITSSTRVTPGNEITLGRTVPMPWPAEVVTYIRIGRVPGNDIVLDDQRVSSRHARLIVVASSQTLIEDLGSSNGTFINSPDRRVTVAVPLLHTDVVCFGTFTVPAAQLLSAFMEASCAASASRARSSATRFGAAPGVKFCGANGDCEFVLRPDRRIAGQSLDPFAARRRIFRAGGGRADHSGELVLSRWGCCLNDLRAGIAGNLAGLFCAATLESAAERSLSLFDGNGSAEQIANRGVRILVLAALCGVGCALVLAIVYWGSGLRGPWVAMLGVMLMASLVGLLLGVVITSLSRIRIVVAIVLLLCFAPMIALGGRLWPVADLFPPLRWAAAAMPSRWAFERLLLLEAAANPPVPAIGGTPVQRIDIAEPFFPAATERMGTRADALALGSMLVGLAGLLAFICYPLGTDP